MNKPRKIFLSLLVLFPLLLYGCAGNSGELPVEPAPKTDAASQSSTPEASSSEEEPAPIYITFEGTDLEGNTVSQEVFTQSKLTMVNVWATYCNPCLKEMPELGELAQEYDKADFQLIGIVSDVVEGQDEDAEEAAAYATELVEKTGASYPHMLLNESLYLGLLADVSAVPTTFFLNEKGEILDVVVGAMDKTHWKEKIDGLLKDL